MHWTRKQDFLITNYYFKIESENLSVSYLLFSSDVKMKEFAPFKHKLIKAHKYFWEDLYGWTFEHKKTSFLFIF